MRRDVEGKQVLQGLEGGCDGMCKYHLHLIITSHHANYQSHKSTTYTNILLLYLDILSLDSNCLQDLISINTHFTSRYVTLQLLIYFLNRWTWNLGRAGKCTHLFINVKNILYFYMVRECGSTEEMSTLQYLFSVENGSISAWLV